MKFDQLDPVKQHRIISATIEVFGTHPYRTALVDDIASRAEVSKGLLFHYFGTKRDLFLYVYEHCVQTLIHIIRSEFDYDEPCIFERIRTAQRLKLCVLAEYPHSFEMIRSALTIDDIVIRDAVARINQQMLSINSSALTEGVDTSRYRPGVTIELLKNILYWCADGFARSFDLTKPIDYAAAIDTFGVYLDILHKYLLEEPVS